MATSVIPISGSGGGIAVQSTAPVNNVKAWIDTSGTTSVLLAEMSDVNGKILTTSAPIPLPASSGSSASYNLTGLTSSHELITCNFSSSPENSPPCDLTVTTYDGYFTVANTNGSTSESFRPVFAVPTAVAATTRS